MRNTSTAALIALWASLLGGAASGEELAGNLEAASAGAETATSTRSLSARFETDLSAHELTSVTLQLAADSPSAIATLAVYSDAGLEPGDIVATLASPGSFSTTSAETTFSASGVTLDPSTSYWVVLTPASGAFDWSWTTDNTGSGVGYSTQWGSEDENEPGLWWTQDIYPLQLSVVVDEAADCPADLAEPFGTLDFSDVVAFLTAFGSMDAAADFAEPFGTFDFSDVVGFLSAFGEGCP